MQWGVETIYPNLYTVLVGPAAATRKSTALRLGESIFRELSLPIIGQDNSPEAVIREIKNSHMNFNDGPAVRAQSAVMCFSSELAVFLRKQDTEFQAYLTDWYDSPGHWKRTTKHQGVDDVSGLCFNLLGAMAPDWIQHVFASESIGGGFTSRIVFVRETKKAKTVANPNKFLTDTELAKDLASDLERIQTMSGEYKFDKEAEAFYEAWYTKDDEGIQKGKFAIEDPAFHTYCGRRGTLIKKVSMAIAASRHDQLVITLDDIQTALGHMQGVERNMAGLFAAVGRNPEASMGVQIQATIAQRGEIKRSTLLREHQRELTLDMLEHIEKTLEASKRIKITRLTEEADTLYTNVM